MTADVAAVVAGLALILAVAALGLAVAVMRQSGDALDLIRAHRLAHTDAYGAPDPRLDRRQVNLGAPRRTGERRGAHRFTPPQQVPARDEQPVADTTRVRATPVDEHGRELPPGALGATTHLRLDPPGEEALTRGPDDLPIVAVPPGAVRMVDSGGATVWQRGSSPYKRLRPDDEPATAEHAPPTADMRAVRPDTPR